MSEVQPLRFEQSLPANEPELRQALYQGSLFLLPPSALSLHLTQTVWQQLESAFAPLSPIQAHLSLDNHSFRNHLEQARKAVQEDTGLQQDYAHLLAELGCHSQDYAVDQPRLRAIVPGLEQYPEAAAVFYAHRDTWYANPNAQINLWLPLQNYRAEQTFVFWPEYFTQAIANDSSRFDYDLWQYETGFQNPAPQTEAPYPRALKQPESTPLGFACQRGTRLLFAAAQLHQTRYNPGPEIRYSLDIRLVHREDQKLDRGAPNCDNAARGSTLKHYHYLGAQHD